MHGAPPLRSSDPRGARRRAARALPAAVAVAGLAALAAVAAPSPAVPAPADDRLVATTAPDTPAGRQLGWILDASARLPLGEAELRAHFSASFFSLTRVSPPELDEGLRTAFGAGVRLVGLVVAEPREVVAIATTPDGRELVLTFVLDRAGLIDDFTVQLAEAGPPVALPAPTGPTAVGTDVVAVVDRA
jgi:hypothetical protein